MKKNQATGSDLLIRNIGQLITANSIQDDLGVKSNVALLIENGKIKSIFEEKKLKKIKKNIKEINAKGALVSPGLIDCHSHIVFCGSRSKEFFQKLKGQAYEEINRSGGGIFSTVQKTRATSLKDLQEQTEKRVNRFLKFGVTTLEIKSGYGLNEKDELKSLQVIKNIKTPLTLYPTFLGAHMVAQEYKFDRAAYVNLICDEMLPKIAKQKLAKACDVFCDSMAFTNEESKRILLSAQELGLKLKIHADQLSNRQGAKLGAELGVMSADHLDCADEAGIEALIQKNIVGVLIPGSIFASGKKNYPHANAWIKKGLKVALSTDCNPGTSYSENLPLVMTLGAVELKMDIINIWRAVTVHAALALGLTDRGQISKGKKGDVVIWDAQIPEDVPYHYGSAHPQHVVIDGHMIKKI